MKHAEADESSCARGGELGLILLGLPKTGTTWLASVLVHDRSLELFDESDKIEQLWARVNNVPILIAESATDPLFLPGIEQRGAALESLFQRLPTRRYVLMLREPGDWMCSLYRQYLRRGGHAGFREFAGPGGEAVVDTRFANYGCLVEEITTRMGGTLAVCSYDRLKKDPRGLVNDVVTAFDGPALAPDLAASVPESALSRRANVGLRGTAARIMRALNRHRRTRWNPHGWFSWKRIERLPWHWLGNLGRDVIDESDLNWLEGMLAEQSDWHLWEAAFATRGVILHEPGARARNE